MEWSQLTTRSGTMKTGNPQQKQISLLEIHKQILDSLTCYPDSQKQNTDDAD